MDKGILLIAFGKDGYGYSAFNLAVSIKRFSPNIHITLLHSQEVVKKINLSPFDSCILLDEDEDPATNKIRMYELSPYEHTLYIDVDSLCLQDINPLFDELIADPQWFRIHVFTYYKEGDDRVMPEMVWAYRDDVWDWFKLSDHKFPATQSSIQYIQKTPECEKFFDDLKANYADPLPLEKLRNKWGGTQPDELYYNATIAQHRLTPDIGEKMFFGHRYTKKMDVIERDYYFLSMFGGYRFTALIYVRSYDKKVTENGRKMGHPYYKSNYIVRDKHANRSTPERRKEDARQQRRQTEIIGVPKQNTLKGKVRLLTSWYKAGNPKRQQELNACLTNNINNPVIDEIYLFAQDCPIKSDKITLIDNERPTYQDFIKVQGDSYNIISNSDIYFDEGISVIKECNLKKKVFCLARWDVNGKRITMFDAHNGKREWGWSQDSWIWKGKIGVEGVDFKLGLPGCDNKFAWHLAQQGYTVANPAKDLKSFHLHTSGVRSYTQDDRLEPPYLPITITGLAAHKKKRLLIKQPGKVGDVLICLPIAKFYSEDFIVEWELPKQYHHLFEYVDYVSPVEQGTTYDKTIDLSFGLTQGRVQDWWLKNRDSFDSFITAKYELAQVPINLFRNLDYDRNLQKEEELFALAVPTAISKGFALVHSKSDDGTSVSIKTTLPQVVFKKIGNYSIFDWRKVVESATEVHCIDSSLHNFADAIPTKAELFLHHAKRNDNKWNNALTEKQWNSPT